MKLGACLGWNDFSKYEIAKKSGLDFGETDFADIANATEEDFSEFCKKIKELDFPVLCANHFLPGDFKVVGENIDSEALTNFLEKGFERAQKLGIEKVVFGSGKARSFDENYTLEKASVDLEGFLKNIVAPIATKYDVDVVIEPLSFHETSMIHTVKDGVYFAEKVAFNHVYGLADLFHVYNNNDNIDGIAEFKGKIKHAHIAEVKTRVYPNKNAEEDVNEIYAQFFNALRKAGCETCSIEGHTSDLEKDLPEAIEVLKEMMNL